jgi:hypothetical protein
MRWKTTTNAREKAVAEGLRRASKFYVFLWSIREELFDNSFQDDLRAAYDPLGAIEVTAARYEPRSRDARHRRTQRLRAAISPT